MTPETNQPPFGRVGIIDEAMSEPLGFFEGLDLAVYCTPLNATLHLLEAHRDLLDPETLITDVVSLKAPILEKANALDLNASFVGSHAMAGGEGRGFQASRESLFVDATVWIVAGGASQESVVRVEEFWASLGAQGTRVAADEHDDMMAWVSHLPQVTANALEAVEIALSEVRSLIRQGKGEEVAELIRRSRAWHEGEPWN